MTRKLEFREIQLCELEVLKQIKKICNRNNFKFCLAYGSLLGAIRHKGIIPWDDDIDIMMPRNDYDKLIEYFIQNKEDLYPLELFENSVNSNYPHKIARISDQRYHLIFNNEKDYDIGVFVDIYPLDGIGNDYEEARKLIKKNKLLASMCFLTSRKKYSFDNTQTILKMIIKFPLYFIAKLIGNKYFIQKLEQNSRKYNYNESTYIGCVSWPDGEKDGRNRDIYNKNLFELGTALFENEMMPIPKGYDRILKISYGDYMQIPEEKDRKVHHDYIAYSKI